ncbi:hypothetical protein WJX74_001315 [Apatococcus lobatus]|uniref:Uncharacterized protein n=1 Tax=Apatococcus lobatus TaxID=904363 RepID=A0AAW1QHH7_9CHLO
MKTAQQATSAAEAAQAKCPYVEQQQNRTEQKHKQWIAEQASCLDAAAQAGNQRVTEGQRWTRKASCGFGLNTISNNGIANWSRRRLSEQARMLPKMTCIANRQQAYIKGNKASCQSPETVAMANFETGHPMAMIMHQTSCTTFAWQQQQQQSQLKQDTLRQQQACFETRAYQREKEELW